MPQTRPPLKLVGEDGNAFAILGRATRAARDAGWTKEEIKAYNVRATSGDYDLLLAVTMEMFDVDGGDEDEDEDEEDSDYDDDVDESDYDPYAGTSVYAYDEE